MSEPRRLGSEDPAMAALFEAARDYRPPARARRRLLRALGLPIGLSLVTSAVVHAAQALAPFKGWIVAGAVVAASAGGGAVYLGQRLAAPEARVTAAAPRGGGKARMRAPVAVASAPVVEPAVAPPVPAPPQVVPPPARVAQLRPVPAPARRIRSAPPVVAEQPEVPGPAPSAPPVLEAPASLPVVPPPVVVSTPLPSPSFAVRTPPPPAVAVSAPPRSTLDLELALVERARRQIEERQPAQALASLRAYGQSFPAGALAEEAELLRLAALAASGNRGLAAAGAETFLRLHPRSPLAPRARTFLTDPAQK